MKKVITFALAIALLLTVAGCGNSVKKEKSEPVEAVSEDLETTVETDDMSEAHIEPAGQNEEEKMIYADTGNTVLEIEPAGQNEEEKMIYADTGNAVLEIEPADNSSADAFIALLEQGNITVSMHDYGDFEKVGSLGSSLPTNDESITTEPGDMILYQGDQITIYYDTNTWNFTRLGKVRNLSQKELKEALGAGDVTVEFSLGGNSQVSTGIGEFDFDKKTVLLNSGYEMPIMGLGTYSLDYDTCVNSVKALLGNGGRLIDTAYMYGNEDAVGEGIRQAMEEYGIPREEIFVITKIYPSQFSNPEAAIDMALEKLNIGYIDMMLLHHPGTGDVDAYKVMEKYVEEGKIRSLGLSNWYVEELEDFLPQVNITPALVQNEIHPYYQEQEVVPFIQEKDIVVQCWYPLGGRGHTSELLGDETIKTIAEAHGVSSAQVILRWDLQRGIVVIPGSGNPDHIKENLDLFGFKLTEDEMERISLLDRGEKHDWY